MQSLAKAQAVMRDLAEKLALRLPAQTLRKAADAQGWPMLFISTGGNEAEGQPVVAVRIKGVPMVSPDVFGNPLTAYAPHTLEVALESGAGVTDAERAAVDFETIKTGIRYQLKVIASGTAVTEASLNATAPVADLEDIYWPSKSV